MVDLFIDTRTAATYTEVFAIAHHLPKEREYYEKFLYTDEEASPQMCGMHGAVYVSMSVAATVASAVGRFWQTGQKRRCYAFKCDTIETVQL